MDDEALKRAAWRIIELTTSVENHCHGERQVWGHDTALGTSEELTAQAVDILKEELGLNTNCKIVGLTAAEWDERVRLSLTPITTLDNPSR
jgi:hypothetical protein